MNRLKLILLLMTLCASAYNAQSQAPINWDQDIRYLRYTCTPGFHCEADDWIQYAPAALMVGLKACGYDGRSGWGQMLVADAFSIASMIKVYADYDAIGSARGRWLHSAVVGWGAAWIW